MRTRHLSRTSQLDTTGFRIQFPLLWAEILQRRERTRLQSKCVRENIFRIRSKDAMIYLMTSIMSLGKTEARARAPILARHIAMIPLRAASTSVPMASFFVVFDTRWLGKNEGEHEICEEWSSHRLWSLLEAGFLSDEGLGLTNGGEDEGFPSQQNPTKTTRIWRAALSEDLRGAMEEKKKKKRAWRFYCDFIAASLYWPIPCNGAMRFVCDEFRSRKRDETRPAEHSGNFHLRAKLIAALWLLCLQRLNPARAANSQRIYDIAGCRVICIMMGMSIESR